MEKYCLASSFLSIGFSFLLLSCRVCNIFDGNRAGSLVFTLFLRCFIYLSRPRPFFAAGANFALRFFLSLAVTGPLDTPTVFPGKSGVSRRDNKIGSLTDFRL